MDRNSVAFVFGFGAKLVALRKESVDRNGTIVTKNTSDYASLSARRAWIEIWLQDVSALPGQVALRKESVDRNALASLFCVGFSCRSPQGERG